MIKGFCYIMLFYVLGEMMSLLIGKLIPGSVCGMIHRAHFKMDPSARCR